MASTYGEGRTRYFKKYLRKLIIAAVVVLLVVFLCRRLLGKTNQLERGHANNLVDVDVGDAKAVVKTDASIGIWLNPLENPDYSSLTETQKLELDCVKFHKYVMKKTNTRLCQHNLNKGELIQEVLDDADEWKKKHLEIFKTIMKTKANKDTLIAIDIGSGTGAVTLLNSFENRKSIALDPYIENLRVLRRALKLVKMANRVKQLWYTATNTSTMDFETFSVGPERKISLDDINKHYMVPDEVIHVWVSHEGYELEVLQGGRKLFGSTRVCFAVVDFSRPRTRKIGVQIVEFMRQFNLHPFEDLKRTKSLTEVPPDQFQSGVVFMSKDEIPCTIQ